MTRISTALIAAFIMASSAAQAAVVSFDFNGPAQSVSSLSQVVDGVTVTVTPNSNQIRQNGAGLGVTTNPEGGRLGLNESLTFTFSTAITSLSALIWETGNQDEAFGISINGSSQNFIISGGGNGASFASFDASGLIPVGGITSVTIFGSEPNAAGNRGVRVSGLTVEVPTLPQVPLPAGGALLASALGLAVLRKRRR